MSANVAHLEAAKVSENFLSTLFNGKSEDATILLWTLNNKRSHWFNKIPPQTEINKIATGDTFFGLGLASREWLDTVEEKKRAKIRGKRENIIGIPGLWLDIDYKNEHHKKAEFLPECDRAWELTIDTLEAIGITPSISVGSGNGFHFYILFNEPWMFNGEEDHLLATTMAHKLSEYVKESFHVAGFQVDSVFDLARVLRLPGTMNHKGDTPVPATIIERGTSNKRYKREYINECLKGIQLATPVARKTKSHGGSIQGNLSANVNTPSNLVLSPNAQVPLDKYEALAANEPSFMQTWERKKKLKDSSPSGYDMSLACYAAVAGWGDQDIVDLLLHHRRKHGSDLKADRFDYYQATISKARRIVGKSVAMNELESIHDKEPEVERMSEISRRPVITEEKRQTVLKLLSEIFGFNILAMHKYNTMPPEYRMSTEGGDINIGEVNFLLSQTQFAHKVAAACGVAIQNFPAPMWQTIKQRLLDACESVDVGDEAREDGLLANYVHEFLRAFKPSDMKDRAVVGDLPFFEKGEVFIFGSKLRVWIRMQHMTDITPKKLGMLLKQIGCSPVVTNVNINGKRTTKAVWRLSDKYNVHIPEAE